MPLAHGDDTDVSLLRNLQAGKAQAGNRFAELYRPLLHFWASRSGVNPADLDDHLQEVFARVFRSLPKFSTNRPGGGSFRGWLLKVSDGAIADYFRVKKKVAEVQMPVEPSWQDSLAKLHQEEDSDHPPSRKILARQIQKMIEQDFDEKTWQAFQLLIDGCNAVDVGERLGMTPTAVRKAKSRILQRVRSEFGEMSPWS